MTLSIINVDYEKKDKQFVLTFPYDKDLISKVKEKLPLKVFKYQPVVGWYIPQLAVSTIGRLSSSVKLEWSSIAIEKKNWIEKSIQKLISYKFSDGEGLEIFSSGPEYRTYQKAGIQFLMVAKRAILADDMGLGKTVQSLQAIINLGTKKNLIICPATLKWNWYNELQKHFGIEPIIVDGTYSNRKKIWDSVSEETKECFYIVSYDTVRYDTDIIPSRWDSIIADEAVYLKNPKAQRTIAAKRLESEVKIALSGMPLEIALEDFHSIFQWVRPELSISGESKNGDDISQLMFESRYCVRNHFKMITGYKNLDELHSYTSPFILRREKSKVLTELPDKQYTEYPLELSQSATKAYEAINKDFIQWLQEQTGNVWKHGGPMTILQKHLQFLEMPSGLGFDKIPSVKLEWLRDTYDSLNGKMVVFVNYLNTVHTLKKEFDTKFVISGEVPDKERVSLVDKFNEAEKGIFILTDAGRFGLNMTGASVIVNYGYNFNPASIVQRENRLHRIGQKSVVHVLNPFIKNTVDEKVMRIANGRLKESLKFMENSDEISLSITKQDIMELIMKGVYSGG